MRTDAFRRRGSRRWRAVLCAVLVVCAGPGFLGGPVAAAATAPAAPGAEALRGPVGLDTWRDLNRLPVTAVGAQTRMFSSADATGANDDGFSGTYSCLRRDSRGCVIADDTGPGEIDSMAFDGDPFARGRLTVVLDGRVVLDGELSDIVEGRLGAPFVYPLVADDTENSGGNYLYVPMTYRKSMQVVTENNTLFHQVTIRHFASAAGITTFDPKADQARDVIDTLKAAGTRDPKPVLPGARTQDVPLRLAPGQSATVAREHGPGEISALRLNVPDLLGMDQQPQEVGHGGRVVGPGGSSRFTVAVDPRNDGVRLTRLVDGTYAGQAADVSVDGQPAGSWPQVSEQWGLWIPQTLTLPASLTRGKSRITVTTSVPDATKQFGEFGYRADSRAGGRWTETDHFDLGDGNTAGEQAHGYRDTGELNHLTQSREVLPSTADPQAVAATNDILAHTRLRISFDGTRTVDVPLGQFFGTGLGKWKIRSLFDGVDGGRGGWMSSWWPMPYRSSATVSLVNGSRHTLAPATAQITAAPDPEAAGQLGTGGHAGYFHATYHEGASTDGRDVDWLSAQGTGKLVGLFMAMSGSEPAQGRGYMEGDQHVYLDGSRTPQIDGIGTESIAMGGYYFQNGMFTGPLSGNPWQQGAQYGCRANCTGEYRLWVPDAESFSSQIVAGMEHGGSDDAPVDDATTAFWYGRPQATGEQTDSLALGDAGSEASHGYTTDTPCTAEPLTSTFEGDDGPLRGLPPANHTATVEEQTGTVSFRLATDPHNQGAVLERTSDQNTGYQAVQVYVDGTYAGVWRQPHGNTFHRWLDDSFQLPAGLTAGRSRLDVRLVRVAGSFAWRAAAYRMVSLTGNAHAAPAPSPAPPRPSPAPSPACTATITSVTPAQPAAGGRVTITGTGFGATRATGFVSVTDDGTAWGSPAAWWWLGNGYVRSEPLTVDSWSDTRITVTLPAPDTSGGVRWYPAPGSTAAVTVVNGSGAASPPRDVQVQDSSDPADSCYTYASQLCTRSDTSVNGVFSCTPAQQDLPAGTTATVVNGCDYKVWLHELPYPEYTTRGGWQYCVSPESAVTVPDYVRAAKSIQTTYEPGACT